jgi:teichuronic acid biosynthesis glycosyltransferase TuaC
MDQLKQVLIMRVLFVCSGNKKRGISPIVEAQGRSLQQEGIDLEFFRIEGKGISGYISGIFRLRRYLENNSFDIIHAHYGLSALVASFAGKRIKHVISFMGSDLLSRNHGGYLTRITHRLFRMIYKQLSAKRTDFTIVKSEELLFSLRQGVNVSVIPNGVDLKTFYPVDRREAISMTGFDQSALNLIFVSDPERDEKNFKLAEDATAQLTGLPVMLHTVKDVEQKELKYYYSAADSLLLTSLYEGSPNVLKEAMACGCPVVSTDTGNVKKITAGCEGYFIASYDKSEFAAAVKEAIQFRREKGITEGRARLVALGLDSESVARGIAGIYKMLLVEK